MGIMLPAYRMVSVLMNFFMALSSLFVMDSGVMDPRYDVFFVFSMNCGFSMCWVCSSAQAFFPTNGVSKLQDGVERGLGMQGTGPLPIRSEVGCEVRVPLLFRVTRMSLSTENTACAGM